VTGNVEPSRFFCLQAGSHLESVDCCQLKHPRTPDDYHRSSVVCCLLVRVIQLQKHKGRFRGGANVCSPVCAARTWRSTGLGVKTFKQKEQHHSNVALHQGRKRIHCLRQDRGSPIFLLEYHPCFHNLFPDRGHESVVSGSVTSRAPGTGLSAALQICCVGLPIFVSAPAGMQKELFCTTTKITQQN
jgi:hypothetical protein